MLSGGQRQGMSNNNDSNLNNFNATSNRKRFRNFIETDGVGGEVDDEEAVVEIFKRSRIESPAALSSSTNNNNSGSDPLFLPTNQQQQYYPLQQTHNNNTPTNTTLFQLYLERCRRLAITPDTDIEYDDRNMAAGSSSSSKYTTEALSAGGQGGGDCRDLTSINNGQHHPLQQQYSQINSLLRQLHQERYKTLQQHQQ